MVRILFWLLLTFVSQTIAQAKSLDALIQQQMPNLITTFQSLHANPELSHYEKNTAQFMAEQLKAIGYEVTEQFGQYENLQLTCYGIVALLKNGPGPTLLYRADMDALPIEEKPNLLYTSKVTMKNDDGEIVPVMHACGHDLHCTILLGVARTLYELRKKWSGTLMLIVQPAEEVTDSGGYAMMRAGLYEKFSKPDYALAYHVNQSIIAGDIKYIYGNCLADFTNVDIIVHGVGSHGASPHMGVDPIVLSAQIILALQTIVSREIDPLEPIVITVGTIHGGTARNIIPEQVTLQMTIRCYKRQVREQVLAFIERICKNLAQAAGVPADRMPQIKNLGSGLAVYNNPELTERAKISMERILGKRLQSYTPEMGGEDFAAYSQEGKIPSALFWLGVTDSILIRAHENERKPLPSAHSPEFAITAEPAIRTGVTGMTAAIMDLMKK